MVRGFIDALTRGGPGGTGAPRPIEMHSHDPLRYGGARRRAGTLPGRDSTDAQFSIRYVGDMLAWLHQATASEKEHLEALLKQVTAQGGCPAGVWRLSRGLTPAPCSPQRRACHLRGAGQPGRPPLRAPRPAADALCPRHLHPVTQLLTPFPWAPRPSASSLGAFAFRARLGALARAVSGHPGLSTQRAKAV